MQFGVPPSTYLAQAIAAGFITALLILMMRRPAERWGLVDRPGGRKRHGVPTPVTGGIAIVLGAAFALAVSIGHLGSYVVLFAGIALLAVAGVMDDLGEVSATSKMLVQVLAAVFMTSWGSNYLFYLGDLFGTRPLILYDWAIPITVFATIAVINAVNMFDGLDGLAGSLVLVILLFFTAFAWAVLEPNASKILAVLAGALAGFLFFNLPWRLRGHHRTFMGDAGSTVLGFTVAWFSVSLSQPSYGVPPPVMLWVLGLALMDVFTVTVRRLVRRRSPMAPDRDHIHHVLLRRGYGPRTTLLILVGANTLSALIGTAMWVLGAPDAAIFWSFLAVCIAYFAIFFMPLRYYRLRGRASFVDQYERDH